MRVELFGLAVFDGSCELHIVWCFFNHRCIGNLQLLRKSHESLLICCRMLYIFFSCLTYVGISKLTSVTTFRLKQWYFVQPILPCSHNKVHNLVSYEHKICIWIISYLYIKYVILLSMNTKCELRSCRI